MGYEKKKKNVKAAVDQPMTDDDWQAQQDLDAVVRHHAIKKDPARMARVRAHARKRLGESKRQKDEAQHKIKLAGKGE